MTTEAGTPAAALLSALVGGPAPAVDWGSMPRAQLLAAHREFAAARRRLDAVLAAASAEVARRSTLDDGAAGLARREGFATPAALVAASTGGSKAEAARLIRAGGAGAGAGAGAARYQAEHVARALTDGAISVDAAAAITAMLDRVQDVAAPGRLEDVEELLVDRATRLPLDRLAAVIRQAEARLDAAEHARRLVATRDARYLNVYENRAGAVVIDGRLDPETAAPLRAALDDMVAACLRRKRDDAGPLADDRTAPQMRADALAGMARHVIGCELDEPLAPTASVVVRVGLDQLREGRGLARIDGVDQSLDAGTARRLAAAADVIPAVMGGDSEVLNFGRARRLFTRAQRRALVERDGGCARCHAPPSWTEAHHIRWWERDAGPTDLDNGVLLCAACHHRVHRDGWDIEVRDDRVWFRPPAFVDERRAPVLGGRAKFECPAAA